jgi:hypothetical protein
VSIQNLLGALVNGRQRDEASPEIHFCISSN